MTEDCLVTNIALVRKNVKDYNQLLKFSRNICDSFQELYSRLKYENKGKIRLPVKESTATNYKGIQLINMKNLKIELKNLTEDPEGEEDVACPLVTSPTKHNLKQENELKRKAEKH